MCENNSANNCMYEILKTILVLQKQANMPECCLDTCDKNFLGSLPSVCGYNTRPITMYLKGCCGTRLEMPISKDPAETTTSPVFRVEKLDDSCCTCRVIVPTTVDDVTTYTATDSFFTVNIDCICVLKCLADTLIESL